MKKFLSISIIMILIVGMLGGNVNAASGSISASSKKVNKGDTVTVTVSLGDKVGAAQFDLNYDLNKLKLKSTSTPTAYYSEDTKKYSYSSPVDNLTNIYFQFEAIATGNASVSISKMKISKEGQDRISIPIANSSISITINEKQTTNNTTQKPTTTNKNPTKKPTSTKPEETEEPEVVEPTPNELIKFDNENAKTLKDDKTNVMVKYMPNAFEDGVILEVKNIDNENEKYQSIDEVLKDITANKKYFEINILKDNEKIQPNGYVTVCIPIPEEYDKEKVELYYIDEENSSYELIQGEIQEDYYTFTTNHFSTYALIEKIETQTTEPAQEISVMDTVREVFTNTILLYVIIAILLIIVIVQRVKISKLQN